MNRGCSHGAEVYDSNFVVATFDAVACPEQLNLVTHIATSNTEIFLHHFRHFLRAPCFTCYSPYHSSSKCGGKKGAFHVQHHLEFTGVPIAPPHVGEVTFNHLDVADRFQNVSGLAEALVATTVNLKTDGDKAPLLSKVSHSPPRKPSSCRLLGRYHRFSGRGMPDYSWRRYSRQ